ncbi:hypothetical protein, partial [Thalassospira xiamenensis]|uniref:hypothetical protein n=1 Tax=Thalassospira xiamenensis TaxID=220697 RepID=UPI001C688052
VCPGSVVMPLPEVAGAGSEVVGRHWVVWWCGWRKPKVCLGFGGHGVAGRAGAGSEAVGGQWSDCWRGWWRSEICPVLPEVLHRRKSLWRIFRKKQQGSIEPCPVDGGQVGGSAPEIRLLVKMAAARGVSGGRGGRLWPWSGRASRPSGGLGASGGEAAERSGFVRRRRKSLWRRP